MFLRPFLDRSDLAFCRWDPEAERLEDAVPELIKAVARHEHWRAIVVCDERGLKQRNPFEVVRYEKPLQGREEEPQAYFQRVWEKKKEAYDTAIQQPLTRLMTHLCQTPLVSQGKNGADADPEFAEYQKEAQYVQDLRLKLTGGKKLEITLPEEVICLAKRCHQAEAYTIHSSWTPHVDHQYSRFYDWNLYFDKMRYLIFDILPKNHQNYAFDYIRFLYGLLLLANNDVPQSTLQPRRVYKLNCENDEQALRQLLGRYEGKLLATDDVVARKLHELENKPRSRLTDQEAQAIFCGRVTVPVTMVQEFDEETLYISPEELGLSTDCPKGEEGYWLSGRAQSQKALHKFLKQPRRAVKRAVGDLRNMNRVDTERVSDLNTFQLEDVQEHISMEENDMILTRPKDLCDEGAYQEQLEETSQEVLKNIATRMTRKTTLILGGVALGLYLVGFLPLLITNLLSTSGVNFPPLIFTDTLGVTSLLSCAYLAAIALAVLVTVILVRLWLFRRTLRKKFGDYNGAMHDVVLDVTATTDSFSKYLSHACNVMRGYSVLNAHESYEDPQTRGIRILKKHRMDILRCREELHEVFGQYLTEGPEQEQQPYSYDFARPVDYIYPIPYTEDQRGQIDFMQPGVQVMVPVRFVRRITVRLEELYD